MSFPHVEKSRHKLFLSFYHQSDEYYRDRFHQMFGAFYISKSVERDEIDTELSAEYIKRLIREGYVSDASVVVVLVGPETLHRKHVDWEISAGLEPSSGRSGLMGVLLPEFPLDSAGNYDMSLIPPRLADNVESGYANIWTWHYLFDSPDKLAGAVERAFQARTTGDDLAKNARGQMQRNTN